MRERLSHYLFGKPTAQPSNTQTEPVATSKLKRSKQQPNHLDLLHSPKTMELAQLVEAGKYPPHVLAGKRTKNRLNTSLYSFPASDNLVGLAPLDDLDDTDETTVAFPTSGMLLK